MEASDHSEEIKEEDNRKQKKDQKFKWKGKKWLKVLIYFWITSIIGTIFLPKAYSSGFIILIVFIIVGYSLTADFKREKISKKVLGIIWYYFLNSLIMFLITSGIFLISSLLAGEYRRYILPHGGIQAIAVIAGTIILILSMKNSRNFAFRKNEDVK